MTAALLKLLEPIQKDFQASPEWQEVEKKAYPPPPAKKKKEPKNKGTKHPGGGATAQPDGSVKGPDAAHVAVGNGVKDAMEKLDVKD